MERFEIREIKVICINGEWYEFSSLVVANFLGEQCSKLFTRIWRANQTRLEVKSPYFRKKFSEVVGCEYMQFEPIITHLRAWKPETVEKILAADDDGRVELEPALRGDLLRLLPALEELEKHRSV